MTKLTQQEIEKEREAFEKFIIPFYNKTVFRFSDGSLKRDEKNIDKYHFFTIQTSFEIWLARAEMDKGE